MIFSLIRYVHLDSVSVKFLAMFLVGVFEENAQLLQWLVFFRQFNAFCSLFLFICSTSWPTNFLVFQKHKSVVSILALNHKFLMLQKYSGDQWVPPLRFFFRHYATFSQKTLNFIKAYPLELFEAL